MPDITNAERLQISEGFVVWVLGRSVEELSLLDPLPEGAETIEERDEDDPGSIDGALLFVDDRFELAEQLDEVLPSLGSTPVVWISYPADDRTDLDEEAVTDLVDDYGWRVVDRTELDGTWNAVRLLPS